MDEIVINFFSDSLFVDNRTTLTLSSGIVHIPPAMPRSGRNEI
jgi:hypothetical protein